MALNLLLDHDSRKFTMNMKQRMLSHAPSPIPPDTPTHPRLFWSMLFTRLKTVYPMPDSIRSPPFTVNTELPSHCALLAIHLNTMKKYRRKALSHCGHCLALYLLNFLCSLQSTVGLSIILYIFLFLLKYALYGLITYCRRIDVWVELRHWVLIVTYIWILIS